MSTIKNFDEEDHRVVMTMAKEILDKLDQEIMTMPDEMNYTVSLAISVLVNCLITIVTHLDEKSRIDMIYTVNRMLIKNVKTTD